VGPAWCAFSISILAVDSGDMSAPFSLLSPQPPTRSTAIVIVNVTKVYDDNGRIDVNISLSDAALTACAVADGRTTWDNSDLYALTPCEPWPTVETAEPV
jgi:hypothetical protein